MAGSLIPGLALVCATAACVVCPAAASPVAEKQRVAIVERITFSGTGTFELIPLSGGPLKRDTGRVTGVGTHSEKLVRNGQEYVRLAGTDTLRGKLGKLGLSQQIDQTEVDAGYGIDTGTWSIDIYGTKGAYFGYAGGGRLSGVRLLKEKRAVIRLEGFLEKKYK